MATERKSPDGLTATNLTGALSAIQDDPDSPDANWLTATANNANVTAACTFPTPTGNPTVGAGLQEFRAWVRQSTPANSGVPTASIDLYENGTLLQTVATVNVTGAGQIISATWNASLLTNADGSGVEARVQGQFAGGGPSARNSVDVGAVEWNVTYSAGATQSGAASLTATASVTADATVTLAGGGTGYSAEVVADAPLLYYRLGESSGTTAADSSGNGSTGTYVNAVTLAQTGALSGDANTSVGFNLSGTSPQYVAGPTMADYVAGSAFTLEAWVNLDASPPVQNQILIGYGQSSTIRMGLAARRNATGSKVAVWDSTNSWRECSTSLTASTWYHVAAVFSGTSVSFYINGAFVNTVTTGNVPSFTAPRVAVAANQPFASAAEFVKGLVDEAAFYASALSAARITAHYTAGTGAGAKSADASLTATAALTASATVVKSAGASLTATATTSGAAARSLDATSSLTVTAAPSGATTGTKSASASLATTATLTAAATVGAAPINADASLTATGSLTAAASVTKSVDATLAVTATPAGTAAGTKSATASLSATATVTPTAEKLGSQSASASLTATTALTAGASVTKSVAASLAVTAAPSGTSAGTRTASASLTVTAAPSATAAGVRDASTVLTVTADRTASADKLGSQSGQASLTATASVTAAATVVKAVSAALTVTDATSATGATTAAPAHSAQAALTATASTSATAARVHNATATLTVAQTTSTGVTSAQLAQAQLVAFLATDVVSVAIPQTSRGEMTPREVTSATLTPFDAVGARMDHLVTTGATMSGS